MTSSVEPRLDPRVEWLTISGDTATWRAVGLTVADDRSIPLFGTSLRITPGNESAGIVAWTMSGIGHPPSTIDGLVTEATDPQPPVFAAHAVGASAIDHVVVMTPDLERTSSAIAAVTGCELKRIREVGRMRQGFHRIGRGGLIVELVERPDIDEGPARFWGLVLIVDALDEACQRIGDDLIGAPKDAVQPGRRIATVRDAARLGLPVALMTPEAR